MEQVSDRRLEQVALKLISEHPEAVALFPAEVFSTIQHQIFYDKICYAHDQGFKLDKNILISFLGENDLLPQVGKHTIDSVFELSYDEEFITDYAQKLKDLSILRKVQLNCYALVEAAPSLSVSDLGMRLKEIQDELYSEVGVKKDNESLARLVDSELENIFNHQEGLFVRTGFTEFDTLIGGIEPSDLMIIAGRPSMGKCLGKGTKVLMYDGTIKEVEKIVIGDQLMGNDSLPRNVLSTTQGREMMYWIRQLHGIDYRVNESHILSLKQSGNGWGHKTGDMTNIEVKDYLKKSNKWKTKHKGYKTSLDFQEQSLPIEPYFLGLWLGDGTSSSSEITTGDFEVVDYLHEYAETLNNVVTTYSQKGNCSTYRIKGGGKSRSIQSKLGKLGVLNNKHIPHSYSSNSKENRLQLLAGLVDSDGYINKPGGTIEITSKYKHLAEEIKHLCDTLGYRTSITEKTATIASIGFSCQVWRVRFNGNVSEIPTRVARRKSKEWTDIVDWQVTGVTVEPDKVDDYYGFEIDGNKLFLLEDCTVTHNTSLMIRWMVNFAKAGYPCEILSLEMSNTQIVRRILSMESDIPTHRLKQGIVTDEERANLYVTANNLKILPLSFKYSSIPKIGSLANHIRLSHQANGTKVFAIDYVQLMDVTPGNETTEIARIASVLKSLAKELDVSIILLSQLNRAVEQRKDKHPVLSDLRQSGGLEENADKVLFVYRDYYYTKKMEEHGLAELILAKNRNGPIAAFNAYFNEETTNFSG